MAISLSCATCGRAITEQSRTGLCRRCHFRAINKVNIAKGRQRAFGMRLANRFACSLTEPGRSSCVDSRLSHD